MPIGDTGRENDGTGLYYYRARYYSPAYGRFVAEDPIGVAGGPNGYAYVGGDPISLVDPLGLLESLPQGVVDFTTGVADSVSWGLGPMARQVFDISGGVDQQSTSYRAGVIASFAAGSGRVAYAASAKAIQYVPRITAAAAVNARNAIKAVARAGLFRKYRRYSFDEIWAKYAGDTAEIIRAASRTNRFWNAAGIDALIGSSILLGCD